MFKLLILLFIIKLYAHINVFKHRIIYIMKTMHYCILSNQITQSLMSVQTSNLITRSIYILWKIQHICTYIPKSVFRFSFKNGLSKFKSMSINLKILFISYHFSKNLHTSNFLFDFSRMTFIKSGEKWTSGYYITLASSQKCYSTILIIHQCSKHIMRYFDNSLIFEFIQNLVFPL